MGSGIDGNKLFGRSYHTVTGMFGSHEIANVFGLRAYA
jgi:hypothetical protein